MFPNPLSLGINELYRMHQAQVSFEAEGIRGFPNSTFVPFPSLLAASYALVEQFLGGGTCSSDSSHDCKVWDVLFFGLDQIQRVSGSMTGAPQEIRAACSLLSPAATPESGTQVRIASRYAAIRRHCTRSRETLIKLSAFHKRSR